MRIAELANERSVDRLPVARQPVRAGRSDRDSGGLVLRMGAGESGNGLSAAVDGIDCVTKGDWKSLSEAIQRSQNN